MDTQKLIQQLLDAFNKHDVEGFANLYATDASSYDPQYEYPLQGRDAIRKDVSDFIRAFPDVKSKINGPILEKGNLVAFQVEVSGTHDGPLPSPGGDYPPTHKSMSFRGGWFINVTPEGKIQSDSRFYDMMAIMAQLGLMQENA